MRRKALPRRGRRRALHQENRTIALATRVGLTPLQALTVYQTTQSDPYHPFAGAFETQISGAETFLNELSKNDWSKYCLTYAVTNYGKNACMHT